jgi:hypothetical protein
MTEKHKGYEAWMGTDSDPTNNPVGMLLRSRLGLLFVTDGKKRKVSKPGSVIAGSIGGNLLGVAGIFLADELQKGRNRKINSERLKAIHNPNSVGLPYNEVTEAWNTTSRKGLKKLQTMVIKRESPNGNPVYYYETCTDGKSLDTAVIRLAKDRLYYEALTYYEAAGIGEAWGKVQYFRSCGLLDKFLENEAALEELLHNPFAG